jgi:hypothetical protein
MASASAMAATLASAMAATLAAAMASASATVKEAVLVRVALKTAASTKAPAGEFAVEITEPGTAVDARTVCTDVIPEARPAHRLSAGERSISVA